MAMDDKVEVAIAVGTTTVAIGVLAAFVRYIRSYFFHPLSSFPGPVHAACSEIPYAYWSLTGNLAWWTYALHQRYGPVVRIAPSILSFSTLAAAHAIYDTHETFRKGAFYDGYAPDPSNPIRSLVCERAPAPHRSYRAYFSCCFTPAAIAQQEAHVRAYLRDFGELVRRTGGCESGVEVGGLLDCFAFDLAGMLAFGKDFGCVREGKLHFWPAAVKKWYLLVAMVDVRRRFPCAMAPVMALIGWATGDARKRTREHALGIFKERMSQKAVEHNGNYIALAQTKPEEEQLVDEVLLTNAAGFVGAGSETVSIVMTGLVYFLASERDAYQKLAHEVRTAFFSSNLITTEEVQKLPYLAAVIKETLRMYSSVPVGGNRESPGAMVDGCWIPANTEVIVHHWAIHHDPAVFPDPLSFRPWRWMDPSTSTFLESKMLPFILGPRDCPGKALAWLELQLFAAYIMLEFDFALKDAGLDLVSKSKTYSVWTRPELWVRFSRRGGGARL